MKISLIFLFFLISLIYCVQYCEVSVHNPAHGIYKKRFERGSSMGGLMIRKIFDCDRCWRGAKQLVNNDNICANGQNYIVNCVKNNGDSVNRRTACPGYEWDGGNLCDSLGKPQLVFHDEFDGTSLDTEKWYTYYPYDENKIGNCSFCRLHDVTTHSMIMRDENVEVGNGMLRIIAKKELGIWYNYEQPYSSGMIYSKWEFQTYSRFEIRCKIPKGKGLWPAFWTYGWTQEIDIFEFGGDTSNIQRLALHRHNANNDDDDDSNNFSTHVSKKSQSNRNLDEDFHVYAVEWKPNVVEWFRDSICIWRIRRFGNTPNTIPSCNLGKTDKISYEYPDNTFPARVIASLAVSSNEGPFTGFPDENTEFPSIYEIDYIRVYQWNPTTAICDCIIEGPDMICDIGDYTYKLRGCIGKYNWKVPTTVQTVEMTDYKIVIRISTQAQIDTISQETQTDQFKISAIHKPCKEVNKMIVFGSPKSEIILQSTECFLIFVESGGSGFSTSWTFTGYGFITVNSNLLNKKRVMIKIRRGVQNVNIQITMTINNHCGTRVYKRTFTKDCISHAKSQISVHNLQDEL